MDEMTQALEEALADAEECLDFEEATDLEQYDSGLSQIKAARAAAQALYESRLSDLKGALERRFARIKKWESGVDWKYRQGAIAELNIATKGRKERYMQLAWGRFGWRRKAERTHIVVDDEQDAIAAAEFLELDCITVKKTIRASDLKTVIDGTHEETDPAEDNFYWEAKAPKKPEAAKETDDAREESS